MAAVEQSLRRRFRVVETVVEVAGRELSLLHPASAEDLISEIDFERDERLPYWAELWPSARALADRLASEQGAGVNTLELGCGSGLVTTAAALAGFHITASDYYEDAVRFARLNVWRNDGAPANGMMLDWRHPPEDLGRFDRIIASDVLYERPYGELVAGMIGIALADGGSALVADPGRVGRQPFLDGLPAAGLRLADRQDVPFVEGLIRQTIAIFEIRRRK